MLSNVGSIISSHMMFIIRYTMDIDNDYIQSIIKHILDSFCLDNIESIKDLIVGLEKIIIINKNEFTPMVLSELLSCIKNIKTVLSVE